MKALLLLLKDSPRSRGEMDVSLSITFKITAVTAEIEIRKHKLMFCVLLRGGVVSALYRMFFHCHEMRLHCFLLSVNWFQLALISSHCFESFFQSVKYGSIVCPGRLPAEVPWKRH